MKLPLFVSATPSASLRSPSVLVGKGKWKVCSSHENSIIELRSDCNTFTFPASHGSEFLVESATILISAHFIETGKDRNVTMEIEKLA